MSYKTETIKKVVDQISNNELLLPAIQRELVWKPEQIEKLFDSVLSGYPFGSMLFWQYNKEEHKEKHGNTDYKFYEFLKKYDDNPGDNHNQEHDINGDDEIIGILDGQQRLTALFLGLKGWMNLHKPRKSRKNAESYEEKYLFINLLYNKESEDGAEDITPEFQLKFKTKDEAEEEKSIKENVYWYEVGKVLEWKEKRCWKEVLPAEGVDEKQRDTIENSCSYLYENIMNPNNPRISYYNQNTSSLDKILQIFVRINSGGTPLDYTDFLMSMIINQWGEGRENINTAIDSILDDYGFKIPKDIFLRACLFLTGANLNFKADNFKSDIIKTIKKDFSDITTYLRCSCKIFKNLGYSKDNLKSNLILLPLALYLKENELEKVSAVSDGQLKNIKKWIQLSILGRVFGASTTGYLTRLRNEVTWENKDFPLDEIIRVSNNGGKNMSIDEEHLGNIIDKAKKGSQDCWAILTLLYPSLDYSNVVFHEDHIYPSSKLRKTKKSEDVDNLANIQLLEKYDNISKSDKDPEGWMKEYCKEKEGGINKFKKNNFIPDDIELSVENFERFIEVRKELIKDELLKNLKG